MKIDRKRINTLCSMPDGRMWSTVKFFASANGIDVSRKRVGTDDIRNMKRALSSLDDGDIERINRFLDIMKGGR